MCFTSLRGAGGLPRVRAEVLLGTGVGGLVIPFESLLLSELGTVRAEGLRLEFNFVGELFGCGVDECSGLNVFWREFPGTGRVSGGWVELVEAMNTLAWLCVAEEEDVSRVAMFKICD